MSQSTDQDQDKKNWPLNPPPLAWGMPEHLVASSVPLLPVHLKNPLSRISYLAMLEVRLAWMMEREDDWKEAASNLAEELDRLGAGIAQSRFEGPWEAAEQLVGDNPAFLDLFVAKLPPSPFKVHQMPAAVLAIKENSLLEWMSFALPLASDSPEL